jgi:hypothetical protein
MVQQSSNKFSSKNTQGHGIMTIKPYQSSTKQALAMRKIWTELGFKHNSKIIIFMKAEKIKMLRTQS